MIQNPPPSPDNPLPFEPGYPAPPGSHEYGLPPDSRLYNPKISRKMDQMFGMVMTILGVLLVFIVLIVLLKSISPNAPTELVPGSPAGVEAINSPSNQESSEEPGIRGD